MNRTILVVAGAFSASSLLLVESAAKGTALLVLAAGAALFLRRDSAATRHLVWLLAIVAMLVVPVLSALLPQWRVLPEWAAISSPPDERQRELPPQLSRVLLPPVPELAQNAEHGELERHSPTADQEAAELPDSRPAPATPEGIAAPAASRWLDALPLVWAIGFSVLIVRLMAARMLLWNYEWRATVLFSPMGSSRQPAGEQSANASQDPLVTALEGASRQLGIRPAVTLSIHPDETIPVVWGILRYHLLLPAAARQWSGDQLRSVLLHELAHVRRRDMLAQLLTQIACALHWFNPLVWFAAWRLGVERERACDDLVLASGVRPSAYAGHLLDVVTGLVPARWTQTCGLAMARRSSLEGRLVAVLSQNLNRRGVSVALAAIALAVGAGIAVPIAMLRAANNLPAQDEKTASPKATDTKREVPGDVTALDDVPVRSASQAGQWRFPGGVTMEVKQETVHAADILSTAILTWPTDKDGGTARHAIFLAGDAFGVRDPWLLAWERGASVLWAMSGRTQSPGDFRKVKPTPRFLRRFDFADRNRITEQTWNNLPDVVPDAIRAEFDREFLPFATAPQAPADSRPHVFTSRAEDLRPVTELLSGVWKSRKGDLDVRITFPEKATNEVKWTINVERKPGGTPVSESLVRRDSANENAVRLVKTRRQLRTLERATLGRLRRGIGDTLLLDIMPHVDFPEYDQATGIVLERAAAAGDDPPPGASPKDDQPPVVKPRHESGQRLFKTWQDNARTDGKIPGGALRSLADAVTNFSKLNPAHEAVPKLTEFLKRIDTSHDWPPAEAVALLDDLTAIYPTLPDWAESGGRFSPGGPIRSGQPLPAEFAGAAWGQPAANGLRAAWVLDPVAGPYPLGTMVRARILFHNSGTKTVVFRTPDWHQYANHAARDAKGKPIPVSTIPWLRLISVETIRLAPGEYAQAESEAHGVGIGPRDSHVVQWADMRMGEWIEAKAGDEVTFLPGAVAASGDGWTAPADRKTPPQMWWVIVRDRLDREGPMPGAAADREQLIRRVMPDLIGLAPTKVEIAAFVADKSSDPLTALASRLVSRVSPFAGSLPTAEIKFRVTAADPDAAKKPRVATGPGRYAIGARVQLVIEQKADGNLRANEARIVFFPTKANAERPGEPFEFKLPSGNLTWAIASEPGTTVLWVTQKGLVRKIDFTDPADVTETRFEHGGIVNVPEHLRDAFRKALDVPAAPVQQQESQKPKDG
jgi:beta-lactamase regulating signal transducer with metallopeptidase domain